jgi:hypothetical protein
VKRRAYSDIASDLERLFLEAWAAVEDAPLGSHELAALEGVEWDVLGDQIIAAGEALRLAENPVTLTDHALDIGHPFRGVAA